MLRVSSMAKKFNTSGGELTDIGDSAHQPHGFSFPKRKFGNKNPVERAFQPTWFSKWPWLHYNEKTDSAFCFMCTKAMKEKKIRKVGNIDSSFICSGFTNWKDATSVFRKHEASECHHAAIEAVVVLPATTRDVAEILSEEHRKEKAENRTMLLKMINIRFLCRQGLPLRGHGDGSDSNFMQTLKFQSEDDPRLPLWLGLRFVPDHVEKWSRCACATI